MIGGGAQNVPGGIMVIVVEPSSAITGAHCIKQIKLVGKIVGKSI